MLDTMTDVVAEAMIDALCDVGDWEAARSLAREADATRGKQRRVAWLQSEAVP